MRNALLIKLLKMSTIIFVGLLLVTTVLLGEHEPVVNWDRASENPEGFVDRTVTAHGELGSDNFDENFRIKHKTSDLNFEGCEEQINRQIGFYKLLDAGPDSDADIPAPKARVKGVLKQGNGGYYIECETLTVTNTDELRQSLKDLTDEAI